MTTVFAFHGQSAEWCQFENDHLLLTLTTKPLPSSARVYARCEPDNEEKLIVMEQTETRGSLQLWQTTIPVNQDQHSTLYLFKIVLENSQYWVHGAGISPRMPGQEKHFRYNSPPQAPLVGITAGVLPDLS